MVKIQSFWEEESITIHFDFIILILHLKSCRHLAIPLSISFYKNMMHIRSIRRECVVPVLTDITSKLKVSLMTY